MTRQSKKSIAGVVGIALLLVCVITCIVISNSRTAHADSEIPSEEIIEPTLNDGEFYHNGNVDNCFFSVHEGQIQLIPCSKESMQEYYNEQASENEGFSKTFTDYNEWYRQVSEDEWSAPKTYIIHTNTVLGVTNVAWDVAYDETNGNIICYLGGDYVDENTISFNGCDFIRVPEN